MRWRDRQLLPGVGIGLIVGIAGTAVVTGALTPSESQDDGGALPTVATSPLGTPTTPPTPVAAGTPGETPTAGAATGDGVVRSAGASAALPEGLPAGDRVVCPPSSTEVGSSEQLHEALAVARPGDSIALRDGRYEGQFVATQSGTADAPIYLCGSPEAVLDGGGVKKGYVVHLDSVASWRLVGFTVRNGQKGVMLDGVSDTVVQDLTVEHIGDEAIHLRAHSSRNAVLDNVIRETGLRRAKFGEGVYVGSAHSNWAEYSGGEPDRSDANLVRGNTITDTSAEPVDVKEGTTGGAVLDNVFDGSAMTGGDSWVDVKGNAWLIARNTGSSTPQDGFQTHRLLAGWGERNVFTENQSDGSGDGYDFYVHDPKDTGNQVTCSNTRSDGRPVRSNVECVAGR